MRKNGSRLISLRQYRVTDLLLFAVILTIFDLLAHYAPILMPSGAMFIFTLTVPITLLIMWRWGWYSVLFAVGDGILLSLLNNIAVWQSYLAYGVGNLFIILLLIPVKLIGKKKIAGRAYWVGHTPQYVKAAIEADSSRNLGNRIIKGTITGFLEEDIMVLK